MITIFGRPLWHDPPKLISYSLNGGDESQQFFDIYSFSHVQGGIFLYFLLSKLLQMSFKTAFIYSIIIGIIFEIIENSETSIKKFREVYTEYRGDSIVNIIGDILCNILGFLFAYKYPKLSVIYFILVQIILSPFQAGIINTLNPSLLNK